MIVRKDHQGSAAGKAGAGFEPAVTDGYGIVHVGQLGVGYCEHQPAVQSTRGSVGVHDAVRRACTGADRVRACCGRHQDRRTARRENYPECFHTIHPLRATEGSRRRLRCQGM